MTRFSPKKLIIPAMVLFALTLTMAVYSHLGRAGVSLPKFDLTPQGLGLTRGLGLPTLEADTVDVLILGLDDAEGLTDVIMVARLDVAAGQVTLLQLPRDLYVGEVAGVTGKLNAVFGWRGSYERGVAAVRQVLRDQMGLTVDYYVLVDMATVRDAVDDLGGIAVDIPRRITYLPGKVLEPGTQVLNGEQAEWLVRTRSIYADGDLGRMRAQVLFLSGALDAVRQRGIAELVPLVAKYHSRIHTDMPIDVLLGALPILMELDADAITTLDVPLLTFAMNGEYAVFVAHRTKLGALLGEHFGVDPGAVVTPWGPPEPEEPEEEEEPDWSAILGDPGWETVFQYEYSEIT